jgi:hypothetical protein
VYIADSDDHDVRKVSPDGEITRFAGSSASCSAVGGCGDGLPATGATLSIPFGVTVDAAGDVYITDLQLNDVRRVDPSGTITRLAGTGRRCASPPHCRDGAAANSGELNDPAAVAVDATMNVYVADSDDHEVTEDHPRWFRGA